MKNYAAKNTTLIAFDKLYKQKNKKHLAGNTTREKIQNFFSGVAEKVSIHMYGRSYAVFLETRTFIVHF